MFTFGCKCVIMYSFSTILVGSKIINLEEHPMTNNIIALFNTDNTSDIVEHRPNGDLVFVPMEPSAPEYTLRPIDEENIHIILDTDSPENPFTVEDFQEIRKYRFSSTFLQKFFPSVEELTKFVTCLELCKTQPKEETLERVFSLLKACGKDLELSLIKMAAMDFAELEALETCYTREDIDELFG